ncbi:hypothetical protein LEMLEM_LOCUS2498 [Lemmus lemmus]
MSQNTLLPLELTVCGDNQLPPWDKGANDAKENSSLPWPLMSAPPPLPCYPTHSKSHSSSLTSAEQRELGMVRMPVMSAPERLSQTDPRIPTS